MNTAGAWWSEKEQKWIAYYPLVAISRHDTREEAEFAFLQYVFEYGSLKAYTPYK